MAMAEWDTSLEPAQSQVGVDNESQVRETRIFLRRIKHTLQMDRSLFAQKIVLVHAVSFVISAYAAVGIAWLAPLGPSSWGGVLQRCSIASKVGIVLRLLELAQANIQSRGVVQGSTPNRIIVA